MKSGSLRVITRGQVSHLPLSLQRQRANNPNASQTKRKLTCTLTGGCGSVSSSNNRRTGDSAFVPRALQKDEFESTSQAKSEAVSQDFNLLPVYEKIFADHLNPILAYRCITKEDSREAPSFLFESVENGDQQGRYSFIGSKPKLEVLGAGSKVTVMNHIKGTREVMVSFPNFVQLTVGLLTFHV